MFTTLNRYMLKNYLLGFVIMFVIFSILIFTGDLIENFRKTATKDVSTNIIFQLSLFNYPSLFFEILPITIFFSYIFSTIKLVRSSEYTILKSSGIKSSSVVFAPLLLYIILSIFFIVAINPLSALFHSKYDELNNFHIKKEDRFASISKNGIWLKQSNNERNVSSILNSKNIQKEGEILNDFMILEYNQKGSYTGRLNGSKAELNDGYWKLYNVTEYPRYSNSVYHEKLEYLTTIRYQDISNSLISPDNISVFQLFDFINLIEKLGYSAIDHKLQLYGLILLPFYVLSLVILAHSLTYKLNHNDKILNLLILSICSIFVYYFILNLFQALSLSSQISPVMANLIVPLIIIAISTLIHKIPDKILK